MPSSLGMDSPPRWQMQYLVTAGLLIGSLGFWGLLSISNEISPVKPAGQYSIYLIVGIWVLYQTSRNGIEVYCLLGAGGHAFEGNSVGTGFVGADDGDKRDTLVRGILKLLAKLVGLRVEESGDVL